jgi:hypothetical protein
MCIVLLDDIYYMLQAYSNSIYHNKGLARCELFRYELSISLSGTKNMTNTIENHNKLKYKVKRKIMKKY